MSTVVSRRVVVERETVGPVGGPTGRDREPGVTRPPVRPLEVPPVRVCREGVVPALPTESVTDTPLN